MTGGKEAFFYIKAFGIYILCQNIHETDNKTVLFTLYYYFKSWCPKNWVVIYLKYDFGYTEMHFKSTKQSLVHMSEKFYHLVITHQSIWKTCSYIKSTYYWRKIPIYLQNTVYRDFTHHIIYVIPYTCMKIKTQADKQANVNT